MRAEKILETCLYARDLARAEEFYTKVLGLPVVSREQGRHVFFRCGEAMFLVFNPERSLEENGVVPPHGARGSCHVAFRMAAAEVEKWRRHLAAHGVAIEKELHWPNGGHSLYFRDPAGNSVELASPQTWGLSPEEEL